MNRTKRTSARVSSFFVFLRRGCGSGGTHGCRPTEDNRWARCGRGVGDAASYAGSGGAVRGYYGLPHQCAHWFAMTFFGGAVRAGRCGHRPLRKACRAGPMCPAVEGTAYVGGGTHGCRPTEDMKVQCISMKSSFRGAKRRGNPFSPHDKKCGAGGYGLPHRRARRFAMTFFGGAVRAGRCGHRPLRKACRAGPMCPAVEGTAYVGGGTHGCRPTRGNRRCGAGGAPLQKLSWAGRRKIFS